MPLILLCPSFSWARRFPSKGSFKIVLSLKQRYFARSAGSFRCQLGRSVLPSPLCSPPWPSHPVYVLRWRTCPQPVTVSAVARKALHYRNVILQNNSFWRNSFPEAEAACRKAKILGDGSGKLQTQKPRGSCARKATMGIPFPSSHKETVHL